MNQLNGPLQVLASIKKDLTLLKTKIQHDSVGKMLQSVLFKLHNLQIFIEKKQKNDQKREATLLQFKNRADEVEVLSERIKMERIAFSKEIKMLSEELTEQEQRIKILEEHNKVNVSYCSSMQIIGSEEEVFQLLRLKTLKKQSENALKRNISLSSISSIESMKTNSEKLSVYQSDPEEELENQQDIISFDLLTNNCLKRQKSN